MIIITGVPVPAPHEKCAVSVQDTTQVYFVSNPYYLCRPSFFNTPMQPPPRGIVQKIDARVEESICEIVSKDTEFAQQNQTLKLAEKTCIQGFSNIRKNISSLEKTITELLSQRNNLEEQMKVKEDEMQFFRESSTEQKQWLDRLVTQKEKEIASLKKELTRVTAELNRASTQIVEYEEQIHKIQSDLDKKSVQIESLRKANSHKRQELDLMRREVDQLRVQQTAAEESNEKYRKATLVRIIIIVKHILLSFFKNNRHRLIV